MKQISVVILSYNKLMLLYQAIDSVLQQDYGYIQLIVSDDGSEKFDTQAVIDYCMAHKTDAISVTVLHNPENLGTVKNLNVALAHASGDFIMPLAADDALHDSRALTRIVEHFEGLPAEVLILTTQVGNYDNNLEKLEQNALSPRQIALLESSTPEQLYAALCFNCFLPAGGTVYRRELFDHYGLHDERYRLVEDWPLFLKVVRLGIVIHFADFISVKHRGGGISKGQPQSQKQYQTDLIAVMNHEIIPNLSFAPKRIRKKIYTRCLDKQVIYHLRFDKPGVGIIKKLGWFLINQHVIPALFRGLIRKLRRIMSNLFYKKESNYNESI